MAILKGLVIASVGDIKDHSGKNISNEQLKKWVVNNKGRWAPEVGQGTTHLISSKDAYKKDAKAGMSQPLVSDSDARSRTEDSTWLG